MGALTSNRKRGDECLSLNVASQISPNFQNSKRPRVSYMKQIPQRSSISRFSRYPVAKPPLPRVHAPCRPNKFGSFSPIGAFSDPKTQRVFEDEELEDRMGNVLAYHAKKAKTAALGTCQYLNKGKEVIELDKDVENCPVSDDSSIEEVVVVDDEDNNGHDMDIEMLDCGAQGTQPSTSSVVSELTMAAKDTPSKSDSDGKMSYSLALSRGVDMSSKQVYKKLLEEAERRSPRLQYLDFQIELNVNRLSLYESLRPQKEPAVPVEPFVPLTEEEEAEVDQAFSYSNRRRVLVTHENSNIQITGEMLKCLGPGAWLNDEVINVYLELLKEREKREPDKFLKCHFFNTFFYKKLKSGKGGYDYKSVRRWTTQKKLGYSLVECDKIFVPIHKEVHWCLAVINNVDKKFQYLDSLGGRDADVMKILPKYYVDEVKDKSGKDIDLSSWTLEYVKELPEQENGFDCGVFMVKYADFYSRGLDLCFEQEHMPYFRLRTAKEILKLRAD